MTKVRLVRSEGRTVGIEILGHAGFAEKGNDIVCAGLSTVIQSLVIGLTEIVGRTDVDIRRNPEGGYMSVKIGGDMKRFQRPQKLAGPSADPLLPVAGHID